MRSFATGLLAAALAAGPAFAQHSHMHHGGMAATAGGETSPAATEGVVQKVDREAGKVTLKHGEIRNLGMPPMTMVFRVKEATLLDKVKAGDKVRFAAMSDAGALVVTAIEAVN